MAGIITTEVLTKRVTDCLRMMFAGSIKEVKGYTPKIPQAAAERIVTVALRGEPEYLIALQVNQSGGIALACAMFGCRGPLAAPPMIEDAMRELANMMAGQMKGLIAPEHEVGPTRISAESIPTHARVMAGTRLLIGDEVSSVEVLIATESAA